MPRASCLMIMSPVISGALAALRLAKSAETTEANMTRTTRLMIQI